MSDVFWLYAAGLCAIAMVAIVWPILWRRSQRQGDRTDFNVLPYENSRSAVTTVKSPKVNSISLKQNFRSIC